MFLFLLRRPIRDRLALYHTLRLGMFKILCEGGKKKIICVDSLYKV